MTFAGFPEELLDFFDGLEADNSKAYWTEHKTSYDVHVRAPMEAMLRELAPDGGWHVFRPYRDVRFSRDKTPYKTAIGATCGSGYVQVSAAGLLVAVGYHVMQSDQVERFRAAVDDERRGRELERLVGRLRAAGYVVGGDALKTRPRGYPGDHPRIDLLRHRTLTGHREEPPAPWLHTPEALEHVRQGWQDLAPLTRWLDRAVGESRLPRDRR